MRVTVRLGGFLAGTGTRERAVQFNPGATIGTLLESISLEIPGGVPKSKDESPSRPGPLTILLNGRNMEFLEGLDTTLADGDVVAIFLASEGG
jgi:sulfur-carrier protein